MHCLLHQQFHADAFPSGKVFFMNLPKIVETPYFSRYCKSTKENGNVTMTFPVNLSLECFRTAALLMVTLNMESRKPVGCVYPENRFKNAKALGSERVQSKKWRSHDQCFWRPPAKAGVRDSSNLGLI